MSKIIFDASTLLALINDEKGSDLVNEHLPDAVMSAINVSEVAACLINLGMPNSDSKNIINSLIANIEIFDSEQAYIAADLRSKTKSLGLSLGDRACLSLAIAKDLPILTADKAWLKLKIGVNIKSIQSVIS